MSDDDNETVVFSQWDVPALEPNDYTLTATQTIATKDGTTTGKGGGTQGGSPESGGKSSGTTTQDTFSATMDFSVSGPRFSLPTGTVLGQFPGINVQGTFEQVLPSITLNRPTLPWQRHGNSNDQEGSHTPWLALLSFTDAEMAELTIKAGTVEDLLASGYVSYQGLASHLETGQSTSDACTYVDIPYDLFSVIAPQLDDLSYLAHVRTMSDGNARNSAIGLGESGTATPSVAVVIGNRMPTAKGTIHNLLVSVEGYDQILPLAVAGTTMRLVLLAQWSFDNLEQTFNFANLFADLDQTEGTLQIPYTADTSDAEQTVANAFGMGYTALPHEMRQGAQSTSWYRGPLIPFADPNLEISGLESPDQVLAYDPDTGLFDVSYAAAWQLGQLLALNDQNFSAAVYNWKTATKVQAAAELEKAALRERFQIEEAPGDPLHHAAMTDMILPTLRGMTKKGSGE